MNRKERIAGLFGKRAKEIEMSIDRFLGLVDQSAMLLEEAIKKYFEGKNSSFEQKVAEIGKVEREADALRYQIKTRLYTDMLIPDSRGDVLALLETLDEVPDTAKHVATHFDIERPHVYTFLKDDFNELAGVCTKTVLELTLAVRAFFTQVYRVTEHLDKVHFWEHEADEIETRIQKAAFATTEITEFSKRVHMRYFSEKLSNVADQAVRVADRLAVYAIKRSL